jgi:hypothetical protein
MNSADMITTLGWLCYAAGVGAILVYIIHFAGRQGWKRPWNAAGLFFTALALSQAPTLFRNAQELGELRAAVIVTICLIAATGLQAMTALRRRKRREDAAPEAQAK